ncbi:hypothetical protein [Liberiplasma polymorphum]|uniref:hypothetical protein n=1 Tax=Liberiplasma polymorphum TaxID=3374570 RepID=UPI0037730AEB
MDKFGEYIIVKEIFNTDRQKIKIISPKGDQNAVRYLIYDQENNQYFEDNLLKYIPKKGLFAKSQVYHVYYINPTPISQKSVVFVPFKDNDFEKAIYEMRVPYDFTIKTDVVTLNQMINFIGNFSFSGRSKISNTELISMYKVDLDYIIKQVVAEKLQTHGRISIHNFLLEIEKDIINTVGNYASFIESGVKVASIKIDPSISFDEAKIQERVTQNVALKKIASRGENT